MRVLQSLGAFAIAAVLTTGIARADLWLNIKAPLKVGDTGTLPAQGCELKNRSDKMETVRCNNAIVHTTQHVDTIGSSGKRCRINFHGRWEVQVVGSCAVGKVNGNTYNVMEH